MNILIVTLVKRDVHGRAAIHPQTLDSVYKQTWRRQVDYLSIIGGDTTDAIETVARKYNHAREVAIRGKYDAMLCVESDMVLPLDALEKLSRHDAHIAYGLYCWRPDPHEWNAYTSLDLQSGISLSSKPETARARWGDVIPVAGCGLGCTLIHRAVFDGISFHAWGGQHCDWTFALDAQHNSAVQVCDTSVVCGHINGQTVLWPDVDAVGLVRSEALWPIAN